MSRRIAIVTGAGSGIGRAVSLALLSADYDVVLAGRRDAELAETARLAADPDRALVVATDVTQPTAVAELFAKSVAHFGRVDLLFNNAGINVPALPIDELSVEQWQSVVDVNLTGVFLCAQAAVRVMKRQTPRGGRIINNGSISAMTPRPYSVPYTSTKHAVTGLTKALALEGRMHDIVCGQIDIGNAATELAAQMAQGVLQANGETKVEPLMDVAEVARAVLHMDSLPLTANVLFMTIIAAQMPFVGRG